MPVPEIFTLSGTCTSVTVHSILLAMPITETTSVNFDPSDTSAGISLFHDWWMVSHSSQRDRLESASHALSGGGGQGRCDGNGSHDVLLVFGVKGTVREKNQSAR